MTWPTSDVSTTNIDAGTDSPATWRTDGKDLSDKFNQIRNHVTAFAQGLLDDIDAAAARATLAAAKTGANSDITGLEGMSAGSASLPSYSFSGDLNTGMWAPAADTLAWSTGGTERMRMSSVGNIGLGVLPDSAIRQYIKSTTTNSSSNAILAVNSAGTEMLRVRSDGAFSTGVAASSPYNLTTANAASVYVDSSGFLYRSTSSIKYKQEVRDYPNGIAALMTLRPVLYKSNGAGDAAIRAEKVRKNPGKAADSPDYAGFIAEEIHAAGLREFVQYGEDGEPDALHYGHMVALLAKAVQEQQALIVALTAQVQALEVKK